MSQEDVIKRANQRFITYLVEAISMADGEIAEQEAFLKIMKDNREKMVQHLVDLRAEG
jgi:hypothetical protein